MKELDQIRAHILEAKKKAEESGAHEPEPGLVGAMQWPVQCTVGPGLEGAIACESKVGYVNGAKGWLLYRGYSIFDLCAYSSYEETAYLLLHGKLPDQKELENFRSKLRVYSHLPKCIRQLGGFPIEEMSPMAALRIGTMLMRQRQTFRDHRDAAFETGAVGTDEDSIAMETPITGGDRAVYEFSQKAPVRPQAALASATSADLDSCYRLIAGISTLLAACQKIRKGRMPIDPRDDLGYAANFLYMLTGEVPDPVSEKIMDICLILHADHGMNASTFASMVVASTLSDIYFSVGAGIGALNGPLHGGANQEVMTMLRAIGDSGNVPSWYEQARAEKRKIPGFGHRVYKAYDPRALILAPLAGILAEKNHDTAAIYKTACTLDSMVSSSLGNEKKVLPNVDFYSGIVYSALDIPDDIFTPVFAVARMSGWTARVMEYLEKNRIFRPRAVYTGSINENWVPIEER